MPDLTPDPTLGRLAGFTPAAALDPAEMLFAAGRASARTPWGWKAAVAGLLALNVATAAALLRPGHPPPSDPAPGVHTPVPPSDEQPPVEDAPDSPGEAMLVRTTNLDDRPRPEVITDLVAARYPLTPVSGRRGEID
jgi:hypothetical protein